MLYVRCTAGLIANYNSLLISIAMSAANVTEQFGDSALVGETRFDEDELVPHAAGRLMVIERVRSASLLSFTHR